MARPAVTTPPGELIYNEISLSGFSDSKNKSCATTKLDTVSSMGPTINMRRSFNNLEKISKDRSPREVCSTTIGTRFEFVIKLLISIFLVFNYCLSVHCNSAFFQILEHFLKALQPLVLLKLAFQLQHKRVYFSNTKP